MSEIPESKKHNHFWIYKSGLHLIATSLPIKFNDGTKVVHAIEYSAYEQLQKQNQELIKALEFYADRNNWIPFDYSQDVKDVIAVSDLGVKSYCEKADYALPSGGRRAREILAKYQKGDL